MIRISLRFFYQLGAVLHPIGNLKSEMKLSEVWSPLYAAQKELEELLRVDWFTPAVKTAATPGLDLHSALKAITDRTDFDAEVSVMEASTVTTALADFETVLKIELHNADSYFVTRKGGYDTQVLVSNAEENFPSDLGVKVPAAIPDVRDAGKCLAFEMNTACGFHVLRATEAVCRVYWEAVTKKMAHPRPKTMGTYARKLEELNKGAKKTVSAIKQLTELHRNPLIHPNDSLTLDEAKALMGMCQSVVSAMLKEIPSSASRPPLSVFASPPAP